MIDADTIQNRQIEQPFSYRNNLPNSIWINVNGRRIEGGHNPDEIKMVMKKSEVSFNGLEISPIEPTIHLACCNINSIFCSILRIGKVKKLTEFTIAHSDSILMK